LSKIKQQDEKIRALHMVEK